MKTLDPLQVLGGAVGLAASLALILVVLVAIVLLELIGDLQQKRQLGPIALGAALIAVALVMAGCSTAPAPRADPRDPEVWRASAPANYPLPR